MSANPATPPQPVRTGKRRWPDMSAYGIHFGVVEMPNGESRLVMVDEEGSWGPLAKRMGFSQSRWFGLYVKSSTKLDVPGFYTSFPSAKVLELTDEEIRARIRPLILARKNQRLSQMHPGRGRLSWHPTRTEVAQAAEQVAAPEAHAEQNDTTLTPEQALRQTLLLGMNYMGQDVYESGDGLRFVRSGDAIVARESADAAPNPVFLRAHTDDDLVQVAAGMVREIDAGKRLHSDDFIRFMEASQGSESHEDKEAVGRFHAALDQATRERVASMPGSGRDVFDEALRLHEGRPSFWRAPGSLPTAMPIAVVMQALASARANGAVDAVVPPVIIDITGHPRSHSWSLSATSVSGGDIPPHDIALAGVFGKASRGASLSGVRVTRTDTESLLNTLAKRQADGLTVFVVTTDVAGKLDNEFRRVLSAIGQRYEVSGLTDIDSAMMGPGNELASRLIVIGKQRAAPDYTFAVPGDIPVIYDYASLWSWGETLRAAQFGEVQTFGDDGREENRWQAPYIPASQVSEPEAMSPRNLLGPVRKALAGIVEKSGLGIDEFVCHKLGWTLQELEVRLSSEQADAVALGIQAIDDGMGMVEADATGLGKGRVAATLAVYGKKKGIPVMFMTEKADLFSDFYRDAIDIGCLGELNKPFVINNELIIRDGVTGNEIARSPKRESASMSLACGEIPAGTDLVLATYSQFNRKYAPDSAATNTAIARVVRGLLDGTLDTFAAMQACRVHLGLPDYAAQGLTDTTAAVAFETAEAARHRLAGEEDEALLCETRVARLGMSKDDLMKQLSGYIRADMTTLKHQWLYSGAMAGGLLILDESHVAAGESSQTGVNLRHLVENASALVYSSATFAKDTGNFLLYSKLFPSTLRAATIGETLHRGGEPMQEILSAMLAEDGRLVRREHDLSNLEFKVSTDAVRAERNEAWANGFAQVLASMSYLSGEVENIAIKLNADTEAALKKTKAAKAAATNNTGPKVGLQYTNFSSKFYNLSRAFTMAVNADLAADLAIKALKEGRKPVITVENTMETVLKELVEGVTAAADDAAADSADAQAAASLGSADPLASLDPLADVASDGAVPLTSAADPLAGVTDSEPAKKARIKRPEVVELGRPVGFRDILLAYVDEMFYASEQTRKGGKVVASKRVNLMTPEMKVLMDEIHKLIDNMPHVPLSPMDLVRERIAEAGYSVDEISGRTLCLRTGPDGNHSVVRMGERKKQTLKNDFNSGKLDALLLSRSGSTGISLHANRTFADQSQRELIELQPAADIAQRLQFWGRVNRKGQVCSPIIHMVSSGLPAEMRLITMQNAKLRRMSANISGNADNSAINENAPDILNKIGNEVAFRWMEANPKVSAILGYQVGEIPEEQAHYSGTKFVDMLTGRMMMLDVDTQRKVYAEVTAEFKALIEQFELEGRNPLKSAEFDLRAKKTNSLMLQVASGADSVFNAAVAASELTYEVKVGAVDRKVAEAAAAQGEAELVASFGTDYARLVADDCRAALDAALPAMLPKRFETLEAALADEKTNAVKNAKQKFEWLAEFLPRVRPGSIVGFGGEGGAGRQAGAASEDTFLERIYVTGWKVPTANRLSLAGYKLEAYSSRTRKKVEMSMSALMSRPTCWVEASAGSSEPAVYKKEADDYFKRTAVPLQGNERRIVLEGNLYKAAEIAESQKQGSAITYTDEKGVWHHAILMPRNYTMNNVADLPVAIDSIDTLLAAVASRGPKERKLVVSDDFRGGLGAYTSRTYSVFGNADGVSCMVDGTADQCGWLLNNTALKGCLKNGDFQGTRGRREGRVLPGKEEEFLRQFMTAANSASAKVLMGGDMRDWYNDYLQKRTGQLAAQCDVDAALSNAEDEELDSLLAAPVM